MSTEELVSVSVRVPRPVKDRLDAIADDNYRSLASQVLLILEDFIARQDSPTTKTAANGKQKAATA